MVMVKYWFINASYRLLSDRASLDTEARISPLINEKKKLFNDLLTAKGNHSSVSSPLTVCMDR